ncbi:MAG: lysophospholipid acyltransferase family protein [Bryobacterales bacterium]
MCWLPLPLARALAGQLARLLYRVTKRWRAIAERNLEIAFPDVPQARRQEILRGSYDNLGRVILALARLPRLNAANIGEWIDYDGFEYFEQAKRAGKGVLFLTAHLGNWELSSAAHALYGNPMHVMVRPLDNPLLDRLVQRRRELFGNHPIAKRDAARDVIRALRANEAVGILADQNAAGDDGVFVDFFGTQASATRGVAQLAMRTGAAIIPGFAFWNESTGRYVLKFYAPIEPRVRADREQNVLETTQRCQSAIERTIRERPEQWLWMHRRWKRRPPGEAPFYSS